MKRQAGHGQEPVHLAAPDPRSGDTSHLWPHGPYWTMPDFLMGYSVSCPLQTPSLMTPVRTPNPDLAALPAQAWLFPLQGLHIEKTPTHLTSPPAPCPFPPILETTSSREASGTSRGR